jgi:2-oxoisovalerate dehydrogenase E1 component beta subunit
VSRVFDTPLAESAIVGLAVGLAASGWHPVPEIQFDGFTFPAFNQIVTQLARMNYRSRGTMPMPVTLRVPSYGGIRAPEHHGESIEAFLSHVPGLKVVSPSSPNEAYHLLRHSIALPDPVIFMEPKSRYWNKGEVDTTTPIAAEGARVVRKGRDLTIVAWGAMVARSLAVAELAAEDDVDIEVVDLRWIKPIDETTIVASARHTGRVLVVQEAPLTSGLAAEISSVLQRDAFDQLKAPVERITGFDAPAPSGALEDENIPSIDRILFGVQRLLEYKRG